MLTDNQRRVMRKIAAFLENSNYSNDANLVIYDNKVGLEKAMDEARVKKAVALINIDTGEILEVAKLN